tara:strand:+ start:88 stop:399 length:312 start_codon:yes stop_codon:yes gene_type:complete
MYYIHAKNAHDDRPEVDLKLFKTEMNYWTTKEGRTLVHSVKSESYFSSIEEATDYLHKHFDVDCYINDIPHNRKLGIEFHLIQKNTDDVDRSVYTGLAIPNNI